MLLKQPLMDARVHATRHLSPRENVVQSLIKLSHQELRCVRREGGDKLRKGFVGARVVLGRDGLARGAKGEAEVVDHCGDQGAAHDAAGHEGGKCDSKSRAEARAATEDPRGGLLF